MDYFQRPPAVASPLRRLLMGNLVTVARLALPGSARRSLPCRSTCELPRTAKAKAKAIHERVAAPTPSHKAANDGFLLAQCAFGIWHALMSACIRQGSGVRRAIFHAQRSASLEYAPSKARAIRGCVFRQGRAEGGARSCGANCLDFRERWSCLAKRGQRLIRRKRRAR
jgi:hypothetical protein